MSATADARWALEKLECEDWQDTPIEPYCHRLTCKRCLVARALEDAENNERKMAALQQRRITLTCHDCGELFTETIANLTASSDPDPLAPLLCQDCGDGHRAAEGGERDA